MSTSIQLTGNIVRSGAGELDLVTDFNVRSEVSNFTDQIVTIPADSSQDACGASEGVTFVALLVEEGTAHLVLIKDSVETTIETSKTLVLTGINADEVQVRNPSEGSSIKVRIVVGG